jgi:hypothetical protein
MFEHFTADGSELHAKGQRVREIGLRKVEMMTKPYTRMRMEPVLTRGLGEPISPKAGKLT